MNHDDAPWGDAEFEADLAAERALPTASAAEREALYARVMGTVAAPVSESVAAPTTALGGPKLLVLMALLAGVAWFALRSDPTPVEAPDQRASSEPASSEPAAQVPVTAPPTPETLPPASPPPPAPLAEPAAPTPAVSPTPRPATPRPRPAPRASTLAAEQALLEGARRALAGGEPKVALRAIERHARRFATGQLVEERELLRVQAWVLAGERDRARAVAERFRLRFPESLLLEALEAAVGRPDAR